ncbi:DUF441 domain-containing protein [Desulforudis sp. 1088]|uniref:DUF441 domain-containing protein n=1 Tax=unclassified Candidatus Desulforudis TaxID=2635950 RepID=UPI00347857E3
MSAEIILGALVITGLAAKSNLLAAAACILLIIRLANMHALFGFLEKLGLEIGLLFLLLTIMVPLANGKIGAHDILYNLTTLPGLFAFLGGALATHLNYEGLRILQLDPQVIFGLIIGSIFGIVFLNGMPVGPLMAAGIMALFMEFARYLKLQ